MSVIAQSTAATAPMVNLPAGLTAPAVCPKGSARKLAKALFQLAGESALASGKVSPNEAYAFGLGLALIGATDNNSAPLQRVKALMGAKPNKAQADRLQYWINATAAGQSQFVAKAEAINLATIVGHASLAELSPEGIKLAAERAAAAKVLAQTEAANTARCAAVLEAAKRVEAEAAAKAAADLQRAVDEAYRGAWQHGHRMDATPMPSMGRPARAVANLERAATLATLKAQGEFNARALQADTIRGAAEFRALADTLGIKLTAAQIKSLDAVMVGREVTSPVAKVA